LFGHVVGSEIHSTPKLFSLGWVCLLDHVEIWANRAVLQASNWRTLGSTLRTLQATSLPMDVRMTRPV
jgi:hypothetical protein